MITSHKTTLYKVQHFTDDQVRHLQESANRQEKDIARWFWRNPNQTIGPGQLHQQQGYTWPVTSTRRAISNLTEAGILQKTEKQSMGVYGKPEYHWQWRWPQHSPQRSLFE